MASKNTTNTTASKNGRQRIERSNSDSARWIAGLLLLFVGVFAASSVLFSFFSWAADQSGLQLSPEERLTLGVEPENLCGWAGAKLGRLLVDNSFGVFGILIPTMIILVGVRIIRQRPLLFNHSILSLFLIMILGSLTLGFAFGDKWSLCSSTGWGGAFGIETGALLHTHIGVFGTLILLVGCWILTGVFINRNFINKVNRAGNVMVDKSGRIVEIVKHKVVPGHLHAEEADGAVSAAATPAAPDAAGAAGTERAAEPETPRAVRVPEPETPRAARTPDPEIVRPAREPEAAATQIVRGEEDDPFVEISSDGTPVGSEPAREAESAVKTDEDGEFIEVDLSRPEGRLVLGPGGLVELERPSTPSAAPSAGTPVRNMPVSDGPFTELTVGGDAGASSPAALAGAAPESLSGSESLSGPASLAAVASASGDAPAHGAGSVPEYESAPADASVSAGSAGAEGVVVTVEANEARMVDERAITTESYDPLKDLVNYSKPPVTLLEDYQSDSEVSDEEIFDNKTRIEETLKNFGIPIQRIKATVGPTVTLYEIVQAQGVKISKIQSLENDIAQSLKALGIRIIAPIPGKGTIGIEVPNRDKQVVSMYSAVRSLRFQESKAELPVVIGRTIQNENYVFDLAKMPHLLVAGATGQGKSVGLNAIITSLLYRKHPAQLKFVMIDPKMVEFSLYAKIERHFLAKMESEDDAIVTDPRKAVYALNSLCTEMDNRLELCKKAGARNIAEYNEKFTSRRLNPHNGHRYLPYIVVVVDEFADLIMTAREVEVPVMRLAQKARAIGIHLIIATQRPDVKVITGGIKANFPARIAFRVMQMIDSRTIIDQPGANQLIGRGDMLFSKDGELTRIQCALVETKEVERVVDYISRQQGYTEAYPLPDYTPDADGGGSSLGSEESAPVKYDSLFAEIARDAVSGGNISTSMIQRNYEVGFNRAGRIMTQLERAGIVGRQQGAKPRDILFHDLPSLEAKLQDLGLF
ncbi:DNA translocase FtsK 4TM domain-containing protein [Alistipes sp. HGB5]|uniref:DNA translocase FtsK 4TM domain-containing protein n=1 Tax=Alistipes sp. HGB5 TaxID=908612 RepID=UPI0001EB5F38|nr:DNA translocase FtsK 4TM domain-containing protein [Alistipes sp. HGB5]EFR58696.1 FtsK/SpoIIIE family protein [Alistipes sp. HGB5]